MQQRSEQSDGRRTEHARGLEGFMQKRHLVRTERRGQGSNARLLESDSLNAHWRSGYMVHEVSLL